MTISYECIRCGERGVVDLINQPHEGVVVSLPVTVSMLKSLEEKEVEKINTDAYWSYVKGKRDDFHMFNITNFHVPINVEVKNEEVVGFQKISGVGIVT